ncbi:MAG TPA: hypothetical protein VEF33_07760 [Syntrophales bacterium]|nr:hypothetical protein [Syntrophales bacterium]
MKFVSYDSIEKIETETEIRSADLDTIHDFKLTWDPYVDEKILKEKDRNFNYRIFEWDRIILMSLNLKFDDKCFAAYTGACLDGLLSLRHQNNFYLDFFATAPWNYFGTAGRMRRIGSGLVYFTINTSMSLGLNGEFYLYALKDAEKYCEMIGMLHTGSFKFGLEKFHMPKDNAAMFERGFRRYVISA